jgi:hypothetical protein
MRRATILVSIFLLASCAMSLIGILGVESLRSVFTSGDFRDDVRLDEMESYLALSICNAVFSLITNICSIVGAIYYNSRLVGINVAWMVINWIATVVIGVKIYKELIESDAGGEMPITTWLFGCLFLTGVYGFFIYPMWSFIVEVRNGIMSRETYDHGKNIEISEVAVMDF